MALPQAKKEQIIALLKEGKHSKREISRKTGVSRVTVDKIERKALFPEEDGPQIKIVHFNQGDGHVANENKPIYLRCSGCGGLQQEGVPCLVCKLRKQQMLEYDCYMEDLLTPQIVSPLSVKHRKTHAKAKK